jgi:mevalonate kinase
MPAISATFPGKVILFGEHAVVYDSHAIAIPVNQVHSHTVITPAIGSTPNYVDIVAPDINFHQDLQSLDDNNPLAFAIRATLRKLGVSKYPAFNIRITSDIPIASGMGSGASVSCSIAKAVSTFLGKPFTLLEISEISYEVEKLLHGTPSGVDNTVIAFNQPIVFKRGEIPIKLPTGVKLRFVIADSGMKSLTSQVVGAVRLKWEQDKIHFNTLFQAVDQVVMIAREEFVSGDIIKIGSLMKENQGLLQQIGVSNPTLEKLISAAINNGAYGAKLSGAGMGGNIIALVPDDLIGNIQSSLLQAGAVRIIQTSLEMDKLNRQGSDG